MRECRVGANGKIKLGDVGAGFIGRTHLTQFGALDEVELAGITDAMPGLAEQAASTFDVRKVYASAEDLIDSSDISAVVIGVPNRHHAPLAIRAIRANKDVLLEKPMARSGAEARSIVDAHQAGGKVLMMAHQQRWKR